MPLSGARTSPFEGREWLKMLLIGLPVALVVGGLILVFKE